MILVVILALCFIAACVLFVRSMQHNFQTLSGAAIGLMVVIGVFLGGALETIVP